MEDIKMRNSLYRILEIIFGVLIVLVVGLPWISIVIALGGVLWLLEIPIGAYVIWGLMIVFLILLSWAKATY